jgi:hypothetical protein
MELSEARNFLKPEYYRKYRELGGHLHPLSYRAAAARWIAMTFEVFVMGDLNQYPSREAAVQAYRCWLDAHYPSEDWQLIFRSIDLVDAYT